MQRRISCLSRAFRGSTSSLPFLTPKADTGPMFMAAPSQLTVHCSCHPWLLHEAACAWRQGRSNMSGTATLFMPCRPLCRWPKSQGWGPPTGTACDFQTMRRGGRQGVCKPRAAMDAAARLAACAHDEASGARAQQLRSQGMPPPCTMPAPGAHRWASCVMGTGAPQCSAALATSPRSLAMRREAKPPR